MGILALLEDSLDKYAEINAELSACLIASAKGDKSAFEKLYKLTAPKLNAIVLGMTQDEQLTLDILQKSYVSIWKNAGTYSPEKGKAFTWMLVITRNRAIDFLRQKKRRMTAEVLDDQIIDEKAQSDARAKSMLLRRLLTPHLNNLSPNVRTAIILYTHKGMNSREIGEKMNTSTNTVKSWLRRGFAKLHDDISIETLDEIL